MQPQKIVIFGKGQVGTMYYHHFFAKGATLILAEGNIRNRDHVQQVILSAQPDLVIHAAGKTNIDWCEMNREEAFAVNVLGTDNIARATREANAFLLHISSGCIQESLTANDIKTEEDPLHPLCYYSWTKVWAENLIFDHVFRNNLKTLVLRPRQLLSASASPRNALVKFLTYDKFIDTPNSCTIVEDLIKVTDELLGRDAQGVFNVVNPGVTTPYRIAELLKQHIKPEMSFIKISKDALHEMTLAKRVDAVLSIKKLEDIGIQLKPVEQRLIEIIGQLKINLRSETGMAMLMRTAEETRQKLALKTTA